MKLTQSQRADLLAQLFVSRSSACAPVSDKLSYAKEMLEAYEAELATWPEPPPAVYGPSVQQMADGFRSDVPVPLTEAQVNALKDLPSRNPDSRRIDPLDMLTNDQRGLLGLSPIRNPENIDFKKYPIPSGYTVASEKDCRGEVQEDWMAATSFGWIPMNKPLAIRKAWADRTYLRPLREDER